MPEFIKFVMQKNILGCGFMRHLNRFHLHSLHITLIKNIYSNKMVSILN